MRTETRFSELVARKERLEKRRISYRTIVQETGIGLTSVKNWGKGQITRFDGPQIATFCKYFGCTPSDLLVIIYDDENEDSYSALTENSRSVRAVI